MVKALSIAMIVWIFTPITSYAYTKRNRVYSIDIHQLQSFIFSAQLAKDDKTKKDAMAESKKILDRVSLKITPAQRASLQKKYADYQTKAGPEFYESLVKEVSEAFELRLSPSSPPNYEEGKVKYEKFCTSCHGVQGKGDGIMARKFHGMSLALDRPYLSPFRCYNQNVASKPSAGKSGLVTATTDSGLWNACFYVLTLQTPAPSTPLKVDEKTKLTLEELSTGTHADYEKWAKLMNVPIQDLRRWPFSPVIHRK